MMKKLTPIFLSLSVLLVGVGCSRSDNPPYTQEMPQNPPNLVQQPAPPQVIQPSFNARPSTSEIIRETHEFARRTEEEFNLPPVQSTQELLDESHNIRDDANRLVEEGKPAVEAYNLYLNKFLPDKCRAGDTSACLELQCRLHEQGFRYDMHRVATRTRVSSRGVGVSAVPTGLDCGPVRNDYSLKDRL